ncbi:MAG: PstS family phosphate ABC transporter substrate-binding protein [Verrucomicrobiales bacterium]
MGAQSVLTIGVAALALTSCGKRDDGDTSTIDVNGSDTMLQVGLAWAEAYQVKHPEVLINVNGEGTGTGVTAMINGTTDFAQASRPFKDKEIADIVAKRGVAPMEHVVGFDGIAVYVHPSNPVKSLSIPQLKEIWAEGGSVDNWNQVGGPNLPIERFGRSNSSGTYGFFQSAVCGKGVEYKPGTGAQPGSTAVVHLCESTSAGIGYSGMGYKNDKVGWLAVSKTDGGKAYEPSNESVASGNYPIARNLYIYTLGEPTGAVMEYMDWIKGPEGQKILSDEDFVPLK